MYSKIDLQMETRNHAKILTENLKILKHAKHAGNSSVCQSEEDDKDRKISWSAEDTINSKLASTIICWLFSIKSAAWGLCHFDDINGVLVITLFLALNYLSTNQTIIQAGLFKLAHSLVISTDLNQMSLHTFVEQYYWLSFPAYGIYVILWYVIQHTRVSRKFPANSLLILSTIAIIMSFIFAASSTFTWFKPYPYIVLFSLATSATIYFAIISPFLWYCEEEK